MSAKPLRVRWASDSEIQCALLAGLGFSTQLISAQTGLTPCQVQYRLQKARIKRADYRNGTSALADRVITRMAMPAREVRSVFGLKEVKP